MNGIFGITIFLLALVGCDGGQTPVATSPSGGATPASTAASSSTAPAKASSAALASCTPTDLYYIDWGGDAATLAANGGKQTTQGSVFDRLGLCFTLKDGNDPEAQVKAYLAGTTPYLRLTTQMAADFADQLCVDPKTCPVPIDQLTWSTGGDHIVATADVKDSTGLKGKRIAIQRKGPHGGFLADVVEMDSRLRFSDVTIVEARNLSGDDSPVTLLQQGKADVAFVITPDRDLLTSGGKIGTGAEGSVKGAHEINSTADRSRSIADLYYVNPEYFSAHSTEVTNFVAGQLRGQELVVDGQKAYNAGGSDDYRKLLAQVADLMESVPGEPDAAGLIADCSFVGHGGNVAFFTDASNPTGWSYFNKRGAEVAKAFGYAKGTTTFKDSPVNWNDATFGALLQKTEVAKGAAFDRTAVKQQIERMEADGTFGANTRLSFTALFPANEIHVDASRYEPEFERMLGLMSSYRKAPFVIRGHGDPTHMISNVVKAGMQAGQIQQSGNTVDGYTYLMGGRPIDIRRDLRLLKLATSPEFNGMYPKGENPRELQAAALEMTKARADDTLVAFLAFAKKKGVAVDETQFHTEGVGFAEPLILKAQSPEEAAQNRRVEFSIVHVTAEAVTQSDFDL